MPKILLLVLATLMLPACAATPPQPAEEAEAQVIHAPLHEATTALEAGDDGAASRAFERAAQGVPPDEAGEYWLRAAELAVARGEADRALRLVNSIPQDALSTPEQQARQQIVRAESLLLMGQAFEAAAALPPNTEHVPRLAVRIEELRAEALFATIPAGPEEHSPTAPVNSGGIALLLPLSGRLAPTAQAVRDGFFAAHFQARDDLRLRVYDVGAEHESVLAAYDQALADGASVVVGPLRKESVAQLAQQPRGNVPLLALNYLEDGQSASAGVYQFGLAPEDEARSAAAHALSLGLRRALALVPQTDWGERTLNAFNDHLRAGGGDLIDVAHYKPGAKDFSGIVRKLLRATDPDASKGQKEGRRRQDTDFLFMVARPLEGQLIVPMLNFFYAADLPAYATSLVFEGKPHRDLAGLRFCDLPWMLGDLRYQREREAAATLRSQQEYPRLFAFGFDAYALAGALRWQGGHLNTVPPAGATGRLRVEPGGSIRRDLDCAQIAGGSIRPIETVAPLP